MVSCLGSLILDLIIGFYYDYRLTLIWLYFMPFILGEIVVINSTKRSGRESDKKISIEACSILNECVINTKTIFWFNFQKESDSNYLNVYLRKFIHL